MHSYLIPERSTNPLALDGVDLVHECPELQPDGLRVHLYVPVLVFLEARQRLRQSGRQLQAHSLVT